jgi:hypothetical protein
MKTKIKILLPAIAVLVLCVAALSPSVKPLAPYEREQTKGNIRVVLLKVERATVFTSQNVQGAEPGKSYPVPMIGVTYLVEALGSEPFKNPNTYGDSAEGISIGSHGVLTPENLIPGSAANFIPGEISLPNFGLPNGSVELPKSFDKKRSWVEEIYVRAESSQSWLQRPFRNFYF